MSDTKHGTARSEPADGDAPTRRIGIPNDTTEVSSPRPWVDEPIRDDLAEDLSLEGPGSLAELFGETALDCAADPFAEQPLDPATFEVEAISDAPALADPAETPGPRARSLEDDDALALPSVRHLVGDTPEGDAWPGLVSAQPSPWAQAPPPDAKTSPDGPPPRSVAPSSPNVRARSISGAAELEQPARTPVTPKADPSRRLTTLPVQTPGASRGITALPRSARATQEPAASPPEVSEAHEPISVQLPASLLVVDDDLRAGAQTAGRLLEHGYACRVVPSVAAAAAIREQRFDAALVDLPASQVQADRGAARLDELSGFSGPVVVTSAAPVRVEALWDGIAVQRALTKPFLNDDLVRAIEAARREARRTEARPTSGSAALPVAPPRSDEGVFELSVNMVRALIQNEAGEASRGRVRAMSRDGTAHVECRQALRLGAEVAVELTCVDHQGATIAGRVMRSTPVEMTLQLEPTYEELVILERFVDEARDVTQPSIEQVRIRQKAGAGVQMAEVLDDEALYRRWLEVRDRLDEDEVQQRFIQDCLRAQRLELAVQCYRDLKQANPTDPRAAKYLQQVGTILSFYVLRKNAAREADGGTRVPMSVKVALGIFVLAVFALWIILEIIK